VEDLEKKRVRWRRWYRRNTEKYNAYSRIKKAKRRKEMREWIRSIKSKLQCVSCGESDPDCLDFHHVDPNEKLRAISAMIDDYSKEAIEAEMAKCIVLCSNCHRRVEKKTGTARI
jgi:hypothetical protein